jgi:hypothetical protein
LGATVKAAPEISFSDMILKFSEVANIVGDDPAMQAIGGWVGASGASGAPPSCSPEKSAVRPQAATGIEAERAIATKQAISRRIEQS